MTVIYIRDPGWHWGWKSGVYGYRVFCLGKWAIGR